MASALAHYSPDQWALAFATALAAIGSFITAIVGLKTGKKINDAVNNTQNPNEPTLVEKVDSTAAKVEAIQEHVGAPESK